MFKGYVTAALWSSQDNTGKAEFLSENFSIDDLDATAKQTMTDDCWLFLCKAFKELTAGEFDTLDASKVGHDFWFTRNGHGVGFCDREELNINDVGERLTAVCKEFKYQDLFSDNFTGTTKVYIE